MRLDNKLSRFDRVVRTFIKRYIYAQLAIYSGLKIAFGQEDPYIRFTVEKYPPSTYWVYKIKESVLKGLEPLLGIPEGLNITPIQCLESDEPEHLLVLNAYRVSGLANGIRAEWSTFVQGHDHIPRYMILDSGASQLSMDPIHIFTRSTSVVHELSDETLVTSYGTEEKSFQSTLTIPRDMPYVKAAAKWITANDNIYWTNGIYDRTYYNAGLADANQIKIDSQNASINLGNYWAKFVEPEPLHILVLNNAIEFVISPWKNVQDVETR